MIKFKIGTIYKHKKTNTLVKIVGKKYTYLTVNHNISHKHITFKDYHYGTKISYDDFKKDWSLSIGSILNQL